MVGWTTHWLEKIVVGLSPPCAKLMGYVFAQIRGSRFFPASEIIVPRNINYRSRPHRDKMETSAAGAGQSETKTRFAARLPAS